jgi:hypothetical protein
VARGEREQANGRPEWELTYAEFVDETGMRGRLGAQFVAFATGEISRDLIAGAV